MEATAVKGPSASLERAVLVFIPPAVREVIAGDLWELYRSPLQYVLLALSVLPSVVISQVRRNTNFYVLMIQAVILFAYSGGFITNLRGGITSVDAAANATSAAFLVAAMLASFLLLSAYHQAGRPTHRRAMVEVLLAPIGITVLIQVTLSQLVGGHLLRAQTFSVTALGIMLPYLAIPMLGALRWFLILRCDITDAPYVGSISSNDLMEDYLSFVRKTGKANFIQIIALTSISLASATMYRYLNQYGVPFEIISLPLAASALYLLIAGRTLSAPFPIEFPPLRLHYQNELARWDRTKSTIRWLLFTPLFFEIYIHWIERGALDGKPGWITGGILLAAPAFFFVISLNSELGGCSYERIAVLSRVQEKTTSN